MDLAAIAKERSLAMTTIESHLAKGIALGLLNLSDFMDNKRRGIIEEAIHKLDGKALAPIKEELGRGFSFGEIKMVMAVLEAESV